MSDQTASMTGARRLADALRNDLVGGACLLTAAVVALMWANSPWADTYESLLAYKLGPLDLQHWAEDGLLSIFFFVAGLELKQELTTGSLSRPADAIVPAIAALGGMVVPAGLYVAVNLVAPTGTLDGWAIPMATDIAFALAVLAVVGRSLPNSLRAFLLTLAVVDDLGAIAVIAIFFAGHLDVIALAIAVAGLVAYALLQRRRVSSPVIYVPLAVATWWFMHESGVHATVAGVAFGLLTRVSVGPGEEESPRDRLEHMVGPWSSGLAVPIFALFAAGVALDGGADLITDPIVIGIALGLVLGKTIGVVLGAWSVTRIGAANLPPDLHWFDIAAMAVLAGIGFTVSLLLSELSFDGAELERAKAAVLGASVVSAVLGGSLLVIRGRRRRSDQAA
jgi:NhaA family Na+:H+ antiporter